jgi:N-acyl amino acid synthase of PEP-CTERM/exosortase system
VRKSYRRRAGDSLQGVTREFQEKGDINTIGQPISNAEGHDEQERRSNTPQILLGMYREIYQYSRDNGIQYWFAAMERSLVRILGQLGLHFTPIGPQTDYYGKVTTYTANLDEMEADLLKANAFLAAWFKEDPAANL